MKYLEELAKRIKGVDAEDAVEQTLQMAVMGENGTCNFGGIVLDEEDYIVAHNLDGKLGVGDEVIAVQLTEEKFAIIACTTKKHSEPTQFDKHYTHTQNAASETWKITHSLGKYPAVTVVDSAGTTVIGDIEHIDANTCVLTFRGAFSGKAYCN